MKKGIVYLIAIAVLSGCHYTSDRLNEELLYEDFSSIQRGPYSVEVGAHTEYHYIHEAAPRSQWAVSTFTWDLEFQRAWRVQQEGDDRQMIQILTNQTGKHTHPMLVAGEPDWKDYSMSVQFTPGVKGLQSGAVFRYRNDRCYYFAGVMGDSLILKMVKHAYAFHKPYELVLGTAYLTWNENELLTMEVDVNDSRIRCKINDVTITVVDSTYGQGKIGLMADIPTKYHQVEVKSSSAELERLEKSREKVTHELDEVRASVPEMKAWKKINTSGFGVGRNLRFGDLNNDGQIDVLIGQVFHYGPKDKNSELSCLTAMTFDGEILWQTGTPDSWKNHLTNDVAFQIHDLDNDGKTEVIYTQNREIIVADGATGHIKYKKSTPIITDQEEISPATHNSFGQLLGDCLYFRDLRGTGYDRDMIIKDRYRRVWAMDDQLNILWYKNLNTGHYPFAYDVDQDGKDELMIGYTLVDDDGSTVWSLEDEVSDHAVANFRDDLPGLETISINFWGNQGIIHFYDANGDIYHDFEPNQYGSMLLPLNWTGKSEEFFVHNPNVDEGGVFDGWGRKVLDFPDDGHPDMCYEVLDMTGDCRDEIVVWDPNAIWVYTQVDNQEPGKLYKPIRNKLYNKSNYQATFSLTAWNE